MAVFPQQYFTLDNVPMRTGPHGERAVYDSKSLNRKSYLRFVTMGAGDLVRAAAKGDEGEIGAILDAMKHMDSGVSKSMRDPLDVADALIARLEKGNISVLFGIDSLDRVLGGAERGTFTILAGRTSMGKSSLAFDWAEYQALELGLRVGFFALEMTAEQMMARRVCHMVLNLDGEPASWQDVRNDLLPTTEKARLYTFIREYAQKIAGKLFINDDTNTTTSDILRTQMREKYDILYVDHIGILKDPQGRGERHDMYLGRMALSLHELAKNTNAIVVGIAQLNRETEKRGNKEPMLSDLQDSGKLEQNADNVLLMWRESYYDKSIQHAVDPMKIIVGKYRDGSRSNFAWIGFNLREQRFVSMTQEEIDKLSTDRMEDAHEGKEMVQGQLPQQPEDIPF